MTIKDAIQLLELSAPFSKAALKKAYRDALMVWHPDRFTGNTELKAKAENRTYQINEAYALLSRIPESDYPYRANAGVQQAKQPPPAKPEQASSGTPPRAETPRPQPSSPPPRAASAPPEEPRTVPAKKQTDYLTIAAWVVCILAAPFFIKFFSLFKSTRNVSFQAPASKIALEDRSVDSTPLSFLGQLQVKAEQGDKEAQYQLGEAYTNGDGVAKNPKEAVKWFRLAANQSHAEAQFNMGVSYGAGEGVNEDPEESVKWFRKAAEQGESKAQYALGVSYQTGTGVLKNPEEAANWYRKAADQEHPYAQFYLALCYALGEGLPENAAEAMKWYHKAAVQGHAEAQYFLGDGYANGDGLPKDEVEAVKWYRKAAAQGNPEAQFAMGGCYMYGHGVSKNELESARWFQLAAEQGDADSQSWLGTCYANGDGVPKNQILGHMWLNLASTQGVEKAKKNLLILEAQMTSSQIAEAEKLAANFKPTKGDVSPRKTGPILNTSSPQDSGDSDPLLRHLPSDERLTSGSILTDHLTPLGGKGKLTLDNGLTEDAFVKMISNDRLVASFYVRGREKFTFTHVPDGVYRLIYCTGFGWDAARRDFERGRHAMRYDEALDFTTTRRTEGNSIITSTGVITLTLHKVANGNAKTSGIPLEEFDRY